MGNRQLKKEILDLLSHERFPQKFGLLREMPGRRIINPLFSFLYHHNEFVKWHAVTAMGVVTAALAETDMESARVVMRRCMWNLNDESGGIGWGSPEAMGDMMARNRRLAKEYANILTSYIMPHGNFVEHEILQRGVLWGLARLAEVEPERVTQTGPFLLPFLDSQDPVHRGLAVMISGAVQNRPVLTKIKRLTDDKTQIMIYADLKIKPYVVGQLADKALVKLSA